MQRTWIDIFAKKNHHRDGQQEPKNMFSITNHQWNSNQNTMRYHLTCLYCCYKKEKINKSWQRYGGKGTLYTIGGNLNWYSTMENSMERFFSLKKKTKNKTTIWPNNPTTGHIPWKSHNSKTHMYPNFHNRTIYNSQDMEST